MAERPMYGVHTGLQRTSLAELIPMWQHIEALGFDFISIWDHFYAADLSGPEGIEAVSSHTALAMATERVRVGSLVYSVGFRHPAVLANAIANIDQLSGGRAELGLGTGWHQAEYDAFGIPFPSVRDRLDQLEEAAAAIRRLLAGETLTSVGRHFSFRDAIVAPGPAQTRLPICIGGGGEKRTLRIAAQHADVWNVPFLAPEVWASKRAALLAHCDTVGRDPAEIRTSVNVGLALDDENLTAQFGVTAAFVRPGVLMGSDEEMRDHLGRYAAAGAQQINLAIRAPFHPEVIDRFAALTR